MKGAAHRMTEPLEEITGGPVPFRLRAWDGSESGPADPSGTLPVVVVRHRRALRRLLWAPGELGLAQAYISGDLDVDGDLGQALRALWSAAPRDLPGPPGPRQLLRAVPAAVSLGALGPRPPAPGRPARLSGATHTTARDRAAISHHYDLSNDFYRLLLDPAMAYSCAYFTRPPGTGGYGLAQAQFDKLELVCRKVGLRPGARLLDIGCGWGSLTLHAARHHGARVTAVTLAREQRDHVEARVKEEGLDHLVEVRLSHYRDLEPGEAYDAVTTIEMGEHVGDAEYPAFTRLIHDRLRPGGRALVQQMSRGAHAPGGGAFIETYIAPDMHMRPLGETTGLLEGAGLEVRHTESLREHYVRTVDAWADTLEERWDEAVALVGEVTARVWRLYLAGGSLAFDQRRMGVDQILAVRPGRDGSSGMPATPAAWYDGLGEAAR
ncbi:class I SAM-dependent methyltransferase [Streptomyces sp. CBG33]|uniref:class I SAM-dependent methyltransferase n=1 Tax=Streptomyces sp. CBG33 TaxID=2762624 RepID=UPI0016458C38|nr:class I SAM-dependent methyltransferase [Streptomyces sp. CBG33]